MKEEVTWKDKRGKKGLPLTPKLSWLDRRGNGMKRWKTSMLDMTSHVLLERETNSQCSKCENNKEIFQKIVTDPLIYNRSYRFLSTYALNR